MVTILIFPRIDNSKNVEIANKKIKPAKTHVIKSGIKKYIGKIPRVTIGSLFLLRNLLKYCGFQDRNIEIEESSKFGINEIPVAM